MKSYNYPLIVIQPMNVSFNSRAHQLEAAWGYTVQAVYTGSSISGIFSLQGSADPIDHTPADSDNPTVMNWTPILNSSFLISSSGSYVWDVNGPGYNYVRLLYSDSSGGTSNGICNAKLNVKGIV